MMNFKSKLLENFPIKNFVQQRFVKANLKSFLSPLCFIHIPKTAGTSFRKGAEAYFDAERILCDYADNALTSDILRNEVDLYKVKAYIEQENIEFYAGHVPFHKVNAFFQPRHIVTFVREPVAQVVSHYNHYVKIEGYKRSLMEFVNDPKFQNIQDKYLQGVNINLLGMVGLTERYNESLAVINNEFDLQIEALITNKNISSETLIDEDVKSLIRSVNRRDVILYQKCRKLFERRMEIYQQKKEWTYGTVIKIENSYIAGWAFRSMKNLPVELEILVNDKKVAEAKAVDNRPYLRGLRVYSRDAFVGFHMRLPELLKDGDEVMVRCIDTQQVIFKEVF